MNEVVYFDPSLHFTEPVLMVPETIRAKTLLVNKESRAVHMGNLRGPVNSKPEQRPYGVGNDLAGVGFALPG